MSGKESHSLLCTVKKACIHQLEQKILKKKSKKIHFSAPTINFFIYLQPYNIKTERLLIEHIH